MMLEVKLDVTISEWLRKCRFSPQPQKVMNRTGYLLALHLECQKLATQRCLLISRSGHPTCKLHLYERHVAATPPLIISNGLFKRNITSVRNERSQAQQVRSNRTKIRSIVELMRWHKPTGTLLTLTPALWSVGLVTPETAHLPDLRTMAIFTAGAVVARGMGCTLNDILDRKFDRHVERTKLRPIACGDITVKEALVYLAVQSSLGLYILCLNNLTVIKLGLFSGLMIAAYPLFKRFTNWPQVMLALTFNWGVVMGYAAIHGTIGLDGLTTLLPIYLGANFWTLYYDTIYAHQDKTDDMYIGVKSSALALGSYTKTFLYQMSSAMFVSLTTAGMLTSQVWPYYLTVAASSVYQIKQVQALDLDDREQCWQAFDRQKYVGLFILGGVLVSVGLKANGHANRGKQVDIR